MRCLKPSEQSTLGKTGRSTVSKAADRSSEGLGTLRFSSGEATGDLPRAVTVEE